MIFNLNKKIKFSFLVIILFLSFYQISLASTEVYFKKDIEKITNGDTFKVDLKISTDKNVNVVDGTLIYDKDKLEIKKIRIDNSILSMWVKEPLFDNKIGELSFVGGSPGGFVGKDGQILEVTFFAKNKGEVSLGFKDIFSVFANDGTGTNINPWLKPMKLTIDKAPFNYTVIYLFIIIIIVSILLIKIKNKKNVK